MNKKVLRSFVVLLFCGIVLLATTSKAQDSGGEACKLTSVTLEVNGNTYVVDSTSNIIPISPDAIWNSILETVKVKSFTYEENGECATVLNQDMHTIVARYNGDLLFGRGKGYSYNEVSYLVYDISSETGYIDIPIRFNNNADANTPEGLTIRFAHQYSINYGLNKGTLPENAPTYHYAGESLVLPTPTREGYYFLGWTGNGVTTPTLEYTIASDCCKDISVKAHWEKQTENFDWTVEFANGDSYLYTGSEIRPVVVVENSSGAIMTEGVDYHLTYAQCIEPAQKDSTNSPTVIVTGIGLYTGEIKKTYTIEKGPDVLGSMINSGDVVVPGTDSGNSSEMTMNTIKVNDKIKDAKSGGIYQVVSVTANGVEVCYTGHSKKNVTSLTIPNEIKLSNGVIAKVTQIKAKAFYKNKKLKSITIGKNIKKIGTKAFYGCKKLKKISIKSKLLGKKAIGSKAFKGIHKKAIISVPKAKKKSYTKVLRSKGISKKVKIK